EARYGLSVLQAGNRLGMEPRNHPAANNAKTVFHRFLLVVPVEVKRPSSIIAALPPDGTGQNVGGRNAPAPSGGRPGRWFVGRFRTAVWLGWVAGGPSPHVGRE